jgi:uncharacterized membrane protein YgaE (UPF0421/DUF939 family)
MLKVLLVMVFSNFAAIIAGVDITMVLGEVPRTTLLLLLLLLLIARRRSLEKCCQNDRPQ